MERPQQISYFALAAIPFGGLITLLQMASTNPNLKVAASCFAGALPLLIGAGGRGGRGQSVYRSRMRLIVEPPGGMKDRRMRKRKMLICTDSD